MYCVILIMKMYAILFDSKSLKMLAYQTVLKLSERYYQRSRFFCQSSYKTILTSIVLYELGQKVACVVVSFWKFQYCLIWSLSKSQ